MDILTLHTSLLDLFHQGPVADLSLPCLDCFGIFFDAFTGSSDVEFLFLCLLANLCLVNIELPCRVVALDVVALAVLRGFRHKLLRVCCTHKSLPFGFDPI